MSGDEREEVMNVSGGAVAVATISTRNYWPYTAVLLESLHRCCPEWRVFVLGLDELPAIDHRPNVTVLCAEDVWGDETPRCRARLNLFEWACASKARLLQFVLDGTGVELSIYVDSDVEFFSPPVSIPAQPGAIILTPNVCSTAECPSPAWEREHLQYGAFNGGFLAVRNAEEGRSFLKWWDARITRYCCTDPVLDVFSDQRWLDLVPGLFPSVSVDRSPALNVATWNVRGRDLRKAGGCYVVGSQPLSFFHYHRVRLGMDVEAYLTDVDFHPVVRELVSEYLARAGRHVNGVSGGNRRHDLQADGTSVPPVVYRAVRDALAEGSLSIDHSGPADAVLDEMRRASFETGRLRARLRVLAFHAAHAKLTFEPEASIRRYQGSRWYRLWIDLWFFWISPRRAQVPLNWISPSRRVRGGRKLLTAIARALRLA